VLTSADKQRNDPAEATGEPHKAENVSDINIVPAETALSLYRRGAGERVRTADLPLTRRLLCLLSYTG
jgi:hypothetical protein